MENKTHPAVSSDDWAVHTTNDMLLKITFSGSATLATFSRYNEVWVLVLIS
jgi:hypothetical protein